MDLTAYHANYQPIDLGNFSAPQPQQQQKKKKNFFVDQISTAGGILGGIGGSFLSPIAGTAAGAGAGSALGQAIENLITHDNVTKDVAKEGALGAVFGAGPLRLAKAGVGGLVGAGRVATQFSKPIAGGVTSSTIQAPLKTSISGKLNTLGNNALASQYGTISKPVARSNNPIETISQLADYGILKPKDAERIASSITGSSGILTKTVAKALDGTTPISTRGIKGVMQSAITTNGLVDSDAKAVRNIVNSQLKVLSESGNDPSTVLKVMRNLEKRAANLQGKGGNYRMATPERVDQANALLSVRNELQDRIYNQGGGNVNLGNVLTPKLRDKLINLHPGNKQWAKFIDDKVMAAKDVGSLRSAQGPFVRIGNIINEGDVNSMTFGGRAGNGGLNNGTVANTLLNATTQVVKNPLARKIAQPLRGVGGSAIPTQALQPSARGIAGRLGTVAGIRGLIPDQNTNLEQAVLNAQSNGPNSVNQQYPTNPMMNSVNTIASNTNMDAQYQTSPGMSSGNPYSKEALLSDIQRDPRNADNYIAYYQKLDEIFNTPSAADKPLSAAASTTVSNANTGIQALNDFQNAIAQDPSILAKRVVPGRNAFGGAIGAALGTRGADAAAQQIVDVIARLRTGAAITAEEEKRFQQFIPTAGDPPEVQQQKLNYLRNQFQAVASRTGDTNPADLSSALLAAQGAY